MEASSRIVLDSGLVLTRCDQCREMHGGRTPPTTPPCETCRVDLNEENQDAVNIFYLVQSQFIMGMNGPIAINQLAIHAAMDLYDIPNRRECFQKVIRLSRWYIDEMREKNDG